jgi:hypothetical protein
MKPNKIIKFRFKNYQRWWFNNANHIFIKPYQKVYKVDKVMSDLEEYFSGKKSMYDKNPIIDNDVYEIKSKILPENYFINTPRQKVIIEYDGVEYSPSEFIEIQNNSKIANSSNHDNK